MIACPQCGKLNPENFNYCLECGAELHPETSHSAESQFFLDLSSTSPEAREAAEKEAAQKAENNRTPPFPEKTPQTGQAKEIVKNEAPARPVTLPGDQILELSPDDLIDDAQQENSLDTAIDDDTFDSVAEDPDVNIDDLLEVEPARTNDPDTTFLPEATIEPLDPVDIEPTSFSSQLDSAIENDGDLAAVATTEPFSSEAEIDDSAMPEPAPEIDFELDRPSVKMESNPKPSADDLGLNEDLEVDMGQQSEQSLCAKCGSPLSANDRFCSSCGTEVGQAAVAETGQTMFMHVGAEEGEKEQLVGKLIALDPSGKEGRIFNLFDGENICGRTAGTILLDDQFVSPNHCSFIHSEGKVKVKDLESLNGISRRIKGEVELPSKSAFRIGQQLMVFYAIEDFELFPNSEQGDDTRFLGSPVGKIWGKLVRVTDEGCVLEHYMLSSQSLLIGRDEGDIRFPEDGFVSGSHAKLTNRDGKFYLMDLGSSNGTFVKIDEAELKDKDILLIGKKIMRFEFA